MSHDTARPGEHATLAEKRVGTDSPYVKVSWVEEVDPVAMAMRLAGLPTTPWHTATYQVSTWLKGPLGTMY